MLIVATAITGTIALMYYAVAMAANDNRTAATALGLAVAQTIAAVITMLHC